MWKSAACFNDMPQHSFADLPRILGRLDFDHLAGLI